MKSVQEVLETLRAKGMKITPQRIAILEILEDNTSHPSAEQIYQELNQRYPSISFTTVYNTLETLCKIGQVQMLNIDHERRHYDPDTSTHHHAMCRHCGHIMDVFEDYSDLRAPRQLKDSFTIQAHQVQFYGVCHRCMPLDRSN